MKSKSSVEYCNELCGSRDPLMCEVRDQLLNFFGLPSVDCHQAWWLSHVDKRLRLGCALIGIFVGNVTQYIISGKAYAHAMRGHSW